MRIRLKMFLVVLPLIIVTLILAEAASYFNAVIGVTRLAHQLLGFKMGELEKYANNQWALLVENNYAGNPDMIEAAKKAVRAYGSSIILSDTEIIFAVDNTGNIAMTSAAIDFKSGELEALLGILAAENRGLQTAKIGGER